MPIERNNPASVAQPVGPYSQLVTISDSTLLILAGQVSLDVDGYLVGAGDLARQADQVFANIERILTSMGADFSNVVKLTTYVVDYTREKRGPVVDAYEKYCHAGHLPTSTLIGVQALASPDFLIEVEAMAAIPHP